MHQCAPHWSWEMGHLKRRIVADEIGDGVVEVEDGAAEPELCAFDRECDAKELTVLGEDLLQHTARYRTVSEKVRKRTQGRGLDGALDGPHDVDKRLDGKERHSVGGGDSERHQDGGSALSHGQIRSDDEGEALVAHLGVQAQLRRRRHGGAQGY